MPHKTDLTTSHTPNILAHRAPNGAVHARQNPRRKAGVVSIWATLMASSVVLASVSVRGAGVISSPLAV